MVLDIQTLLFINFIVNIISLGAMVIVWQRYRQRFAGLSYWVVHMAFQVILLIALVLMVTRRLLSEVQAEEEKFTKAFHSSPYAIMVTRALDGKIIEVN